MPPSLDNQISVGYYQSGSYFIMNIFGTEEHQPEVVLLPVDGVLQSDFEFQDLLRNLK